ncbi:MAG: polysaccharide deacetylase family protein [Acidimicrobiales bacterium]
MKLLASGAALALAGCGPEMSHLSGARANRSKLATAGPAPIVTDPSGAPPVDLGSIPASRGGSPEVVWGGPEGTRQIALTVDDGYCGPCIAGYVEFAQSSGIHLTFNPNGVFGDLWKPSLVASVRQMIANRQVQIGNHTWNHANLLPLGDTQVQSEINHNESWIQQTFGVTARPWFRPPYGYYDKRIEQLAADIGYTKILMWNGTFGDATLESPAALLGLAEKWMTPGTIMLGHLNHPTILSLFSQIEAIIAQRNLEPVTLDEMFGTSRQIG